ncbi:stAR-related lipid transfer protein 9 isoform X2 [Phyllopteryx taeniolatus]|uniref:stAR-related lipid transfer protein 9 isoform X2 n=1 Tax=Phyllopteryx taeniolatus TaxID=161469 RepID=UPI002AD2AD35|nr:stAR-related lipid transfer protein 9 isoform X2 [Phyllopteryx taeniolatus]
MANVKVAVRVRPLNARESADGGRLAVQVDDKFVRIQNVKLDPRADHAVDSREKLLEFRFDYCYWSAQPEDPRCASQEEVFQDLGASVLAGASEGYNVCLFAYGQTGSGKTYTMMGTPDSTGLTPRICQGLFRSQDTLPDGQNSSRVEISFLEIYNERVRDLLGSSERKTRTSLRVREHPEKGPYVQDLSQHVVSDCQQAVNLLEAGIANRITAATHNHEASSRSHAIFTIQYTQAILENNRPSETVSKINLVDLAGSERADPNYCRDRLTEGSNINKSLVTLGIVISALAQNSQMSSSCQSINSVASEGDGSTAGSHSSFLSGGASAGRRHCFIPYRDSVLTWLLKDSLGGNSKTIMIATVSPSASSYNETLSTLRYAAHARNIVNKPRVNEDANVRLIRDLREEIDRLKSMLLSFEMRNPSPSLSDEREGMLSDMVLQNELKVEQLTKDWSESWQDKRELLEQYSVDINRDRAGFLINSMRPHLVALDGDVLSTGVVFYHLTEGITRIGSQDQFEEPQIVLPGGASCVIQNDGGVVTLRPLPGCTCLLNDREVTEPCRLAQGMVITLGGLHKFRFNHPAEAAVLRERRRASEGTYIDLCPPTPDHCKEEEGLPAVCLSSEESTARRRVEEQQCYVEGLRQEIGSEQRRAEKELEREQAHFQQQHSEIHQWILQEKCHLLAVEQRVTQDLGVQTDSQPDPLLERLAGLMSDDREVQRENCPSLVVRVRKKAVQEELLKHHALCRAERRLRRNKLQFQLERIARKRHLLEAKRELQHLEKALSPGPESPEQVSPPKFVFPRHSFSADLVSRLYPHHTPIFRHFLKRNKSTELTSNSTSLACINSRKWVSDECLPRERTQSCSGNLPTGLNQSCQGRGRSSENIALNSKVEENSQERQYRRYTERKPLLPQKELSFKNRSDRNAAATPKLPLCIPVQPLGKENVASKTDIPMIHCNDVKRQTQSGVTSKSFSSSVRPKALGKLPSGSKNCSPNRFPRSHEDSGGMSGSTIKTAISCEELEQRRPFEFSRRWHSTEALINKTGQWVERQQQWKANCEWQVQEEGRKEASDSESLFSVDSLSSAYATALLEQLKREEAAQSEADSEDSEMSKDSLVVEKYSVVKRSCQKVVPTYTFVTDPPCGNRIMAMGLELGSYQEPKVVPAKMNWTQQDHLKSTPEIPLGDSLRDIAQNLTEDNIGQTSVLGSPGVRLSKHLLPPMDARSSFEVAGGSVIHRDSPPFRIESSECSCPVSVSLSDGLSPSQGYSSTSTNSQGLNDQPTEELMSQNEKHSDTRAECLIIADPSSLSQNCKEDVALDLHSSGCQTERLLMYPTGQGQAIRTDEVLCNLDVTVKESELPDLGITKDCSFASAESADGNETKDADTAYFARQCESACKNSRKRNKEQKEAFVGSLKIPKRSPSPVANQGAPWSDNNNTCNSKKEHCDVKISNFGLLSADISDSMLRKLEKLNGPSVGDMRVQHVAIKQVVAESNEAGSQNDNAGRKHCCHSEAICSAIDLRISQVVQGHLKLSLISSSGDGNNWSQSNWSKTLVSDCDDQRIKQIKNQTRDNKNNQVKGLTNDGEAAEKRLRASEVKTVVTAAKPVEELTAHEVSDSCTDRTNDTSQANKTNELNLPNIDCSKEVRSQNCSEALDSAAPWLCQTDITEGNCLEGTSCIDCGHSCNQQSPKEVEHLCKLSSDGYHFTDATRGNKPSVKGADQHSSQRLRDHSQTCVTNRNYSNNKCQDCQCKFDKAQVNPKCPCMTVQSDSERLPALEDKKTVKNRSGYGSEMANVATQCHSSLKKNKSKRFRRRKIHHSSTSSQTSSSDADQTSSKRSSTQLRLESEGKTDVSKSNAENSKVGTKIEMIKEVTHCRKRLSLPPLTISPRTNDLQNGVKSEESLMHFASSDINPFVHQWQDGDRLCGKNPTFGSAADLSHKFPLLNVAEKCITRCCSVDNGLNRQNSPFNSHLSTYAAHKGLSSTLSSIEPSVNTTSSSGFFHSSDPELSQSVAQRTMKEHGTQTELVPPATPSRKEQHKRTHTDAPKTSVQMNESLTWTSMESMSVQLAKLIHSTSDLLGDLQGLRTGRISGLSPRSIPNISVDCSTQNALDVGVQTERPWTPANTEMHQRPKYHEVNVTLRLTGAESVSPDKDSLYLVKTETGNKEERTSNVFQPQTSSLKTAPVSCRRQVKSAPIKKTLPETLHHRSTVASENSWRPNGGKEKQRPWVRNPSKPATTFTDRASSPIVTVGVRKQLKPRERNQNECTEEKSFTDSPCRSSGLDCGICSSELPEEVSEMSSSPKDSEDCFQSSSVDRRNTHHNGNARPQPKGNSSQSPQCYDFSLHDYVCATARKIDAHVTKYENMPSTKPAHQRPLAFSFCGGTCSPSPAASLTPSECSTDVLVNAKPITSVDPDTLPEDLPLHDKFNDWAGITRLRSRRCTFSDAAESCAFNSEARLREIERLRQEREQVMASVGLGANSTPLTVELAEAKLHYGLGETDALLKMLSPRSTEELAVKCATSNLGKQQLHDRHRLSIEGLREKAEEEPKTGPRARSLSPCTRHLGSPPATPGRRLKPEITGIRDPASGDGAYPSDVEQLLCDYGRAREEAIGEITKARERLHERTEREKRRLQQQASSPESKDDPRQGARISNSTLCTGSSRSLSSGPTSGYNSGNTLQLQHGHTFTPGHASTFVEEGEKASSRINISAQDGRVEPLMTSSPRSPPSRSRRRAASFGSTCSSSVSGSYRDIAAALLGRALAEVRLASCGDLSNLVKGKASAGWRHQGEERGIQAYYRPSSSPSVHAFLGAAELDGPPERLWAVLRRPRNAQDYHPSVRTAWTRPLDGSTHLVYILTDASSCHFSQPRDFCCISAESQQGDVRVLAMQSAFDESLPRPGPDAVRGEMMPSCWLLQPIGRGGCGREATRAVYLLQVDLGTPSLPARLLGAVARRQAAVVADLADALDT